jgi:hypothetical protein
MKLVYFTNLLKLAFLISDFKSFVTIATTVLKFDMDVIEGFS